MSGNVWEWTCSAWRDYFGSEEQQCAERESTVARVVRGGSWFNFPDIARSASRHSLHPVFRDINLDFRVLCSSTIDG
jgi:formylglycine-generating enzyme required for sulfatase activity